MTKFVLKCFLPPGDNVVLTAALRDLHRQYPGRFLTDVRTSYPEIWQNNPDLTPIEDGASGVDWIDCHYPLIQDSNQRPCHFIEGFIAHLNEHLGLSIRPTAFKGEVYLSEDEKASRSPVEELAGYGGPYWLVASGGKRDYTVKWWSAKRHQELVDPFHDRIQFVQVGVLLRSNPSM